MDLCTYKITISHKRIDVEGWGHMQIRAVDHLYKLSFMTNNGFMTIPRVIACFVKANVDFAPKFQICCRIKWDNLLTA